MARNTRSTRKVSSRLSSDDRTSDIMAVARAVIAEKGYENTLLSDIAERAGIVEGTIYRYFENKRELLVRVAEAWFTEQLAQDSHVESIDGTLNKLRHLAWMNLSVVRRDPVLARFMLLELRPDPAYRSTAFFDLNRRFTSDVIKVCKAAIESGEFAADVSPSALRDMFYGCMEHRTWAFLRGEGDFSIEDVADNVARVIYRGMAVHVPSSVPADLEQMVKRLEAVASSLERKLKP